MAKKNYDEIAKLIIENVGGKENVAQVPHCMTRLRFTLKDSAVPKDEDVKKIDGVMGIARSGGQYQVIIGQDVPKAYEAVCKIGGFANQAQLQENLDAPKEKLTLKKIGSNILNYISGSVTPLIPVMVASAMFKMVQVVVGPDMLGLISAESDLYVLTNFLYNAFYYFLPLFVGVSAAKKLNVNQYLGLYAGAILLAPGFLDVVAAGEPFTVYGIPAPLYNYCQTLIPVLLSVWVMSYVYRFFGRVIPDTLATLFAPFATMVVMVPLEFCLLAPLGNWIGELIGNGMIAFGGYGGFVAVALVAGLWQLLVVSGMHTVLITFAMVNAMSYGSDAFVMPAASCATYAAFGMALGAFLRIRNKEEKSMAGGCFVSGILGGVTEPAMFGIGLKYKKPLIALMIGGAAGGLYAGVMHVGVYTRSVSNFLGFLAYLAGGTSNFVNGIIASVIAFSVAAVCTYLFGFDKNSDALKK